MPAGRPTEYSEDLANRICELVALGGNITKICLDETMPSQAAVYNWLDIHPEFVEKLKLCREKRADTRADRIDDWALQVVHGTLKPEAAKIVIDAEKWQAGRENPKRYGDKQQVEHTGKVELTASPAERKKLEDTKADNLITKLDSAG